jgi:hypothetical protein
MTFSLDEHYEHFMKNYSRHGAVYTFVLCGIAGALVDIDHIPKILYLLMGGSRKITGRMLHPIFFLIACCVCIYFGALLCNSFLAHYGYKENETQIRN